MVGEDERDERSVLEPGTDDRAGENNIDTGCEPAVANWLAIFAPRRVIQFRKRLRDRAALIVRGARLGGSHHYPEFGQ